MRGSVAGCAIVRACCRLPCPCCACRAAVRVPGGPVDRWRAAEAALDPEVERDLTRRGIPRTPVRRRTPRRSQVSSRPKESPSDVHDPQRGPRRQRAVRRRVRRTREPRPAAGARLRDPHLHGRPPRPGQVRRPQGGRRPRHPQRRRPRQRRRDPLAGHLVQVARHSANGSSSTTPTAGWSSSPTT